MLQFIAQTNDRYSVEETVQMAIEGGCQWIQLHLPDLTDEDIKSISPDIIALCKESAAFLMLEDRMELAKELGIHGVHINNPGDITAAKIREMLGPEAVIGISTPTSAAILALRNADIDYVTLPETMQPEEIAELVATIREAGIEIPVVATGNISAEDAPVYIAAGCSGIATGMPIIKAKDPVKETKLTIGALTEAKNS